MISDNSTPPMFRTLATTLERVNSRGALRPRYTPPSPSCIDPTTTADTTQPLSSSTFPGLHQGLDEYIGGTRVQRTHQVSRRNKSRIANQNTNMKNAPSGRPRPVPYSPDSPHQTSQTLPQSYATIPHCSSPQDPVTPNARYETCTIGCLGGESWRVDRRGNPGRVGHPGEE